MNKQDAKKQFNDLTEKFNIEHTFSFDEAWSYVKYMKSVKSLQKPFDFIPPKYTKQEFKEEIVKVEERMKQKDEVLRTAEEIESFNPLKHMFADGLYIREIFNPKGELLVTKIHKVKHPFFLLRGDMTIFTEDGIKRIKAPHYGITYPGTKRIIYCNEDCVFVTVHATEETDISKIEKEVIAEDFNEIDVMNGKVN